MKIASRLLFLFLLLPVSLHAEGLVVAALKRDTAVDFATEVYPFLKTNCLACHNQSKPKADLILESPQDMIKGGESGPAIIPGKGAESFLFSTAAHLEEPTMPPANNKSKAENLSPDQLALLKLWIDQGAKGGAVATAAPESWTLLTGPQPIYTAAISPDGRFAAAGRGQQVHLYDLRLGKLAATLRDPALTIPVAHEDVVQALAFSPDGATLATAGFRVVKVFKRSPLAAASVVPLTGDPVVMAVSPDGKHTAVGAADGSVSLLDNDLPAAAPAASKAHGGPVTALAFSLDGTSLFSAAADKTLRVGSLADPAKATTITLPAPALSLALVNGGKHLLLACADQTLRLCATDLKGELAFTPTPAPAPAAAPGAAQPGPPSKTILEFKPLPEALVAVAGTKGDGSEFAAAYADGSVILFAINSAKPGDLPTELRRLAHGAALSGLAVSLKGPSGPRLATSGTTGPVNLWNPADGRKVFEFKGDPSLAPRLAALQRETTIATRRKTHWDQLLPEAETLSKAESEKALQAGDELARARRDLALKQEGLRALEAAVPASSEEVLTKGREALVVAERLVSGSARNRDLSATLAGEAFGRAIAAKSASKESESLVVALKAEAETLPKTALEAAKTSLTTGLLFSADGSLVIQSLTGGRWRLFSAHSGSWLEDISTGKEVLSLVAVGDRLFSISKDIDFMRWTLPGSDWTLAATLGDGKSPDPFVDRVTALAFHPEGRKLMTGSGMPSRNGQVALWDTATWSLLVANPKVHADTLTAFAFSSDGSRVATASTDKLIKILDSETLEVKQTFEGHTNHVLDVAWNLDDLYLASASGDLKVKVWDLSDGRVKSTVDGYRKEIGTVSYVGATESLLTASGDKVVKLANQPLPDSGDTFLHCAEASADGTRIIAGGQDSLLRLWDGTTKKLLLSFPSPEAEAGKVAGK